MARCQDFPCCGHESGCCPDYDDAGNQLNMVCTCGAKLSVSARYSICDSCMNSMDEDSNHDYNDDYFDHDEYLENAEFERADEYYGVDSHLEDYGDFGYEGCHEE